MKHAVFVAGLALIASLGSMAAGAQTPGQQPASDRENANPTALDFWVAGHDTSDSRKDVREVTRPLPPSGPATPVPYCSPGSPICP